MRNKLLEIIKSHHIHIALATGASIIVMAYVSKLILLESIGYLPMALPPFIGVIFELLLSEHKDSKFCVT